MNHPIPSPDDTEELLLACRYGDMEDVRSFLERFGASPISRARDQNENTVLHMAAANGHAELLDLLLPIVPPSLLSATNRAGSTPLHWAAINSQLAAAHALVNFPGGAGIDLIDIKNAAGRSSLGEAEVAGWDEGAKWMVQVMRLDNSGGAESDAPLPSPSGERVQVGDEDSEDFDGQISDVPTASVDKSEGEGDSESLPS